MTGAKKRVRGAQTDNATLELFAEAGAGAPGGRAPANQTTAGGDDFVNMAEFAERSYLTYAMSVVRGRAIPNVEDVWGSSAYDVWFTLGNGQLLHLHDTTPPILDACPVAGPFIQGSGPQTVGPIGVDASVSGLDAGASALTGLVETASVGSRSVTFTAVDNAGNSASATCSYQVIFDWAGFFQPATNPPVLDQVKAGQAIPMKFSLAGNQGLDILAAGSPASQQIACDSSAPVDDIEQTVTAGNSSLSYDPASDQYTYVWKTGKAWTGTCRQLIVALADGTEQRANFKFK